MKQLDAKEIYSKGKSLWNTKVKQTINTNRGINYCMDLSISTLNT